MDAFEQIKNVPISDVLDKLWIRYLRQWTMMHLYEWDRVTHGWKANSVDDIVKDFAWKRAEWDRITFVMKHLWLSSKAEVVKWYEREFWIEKWKTSERAIRQVQVTQQKMNKEIAAKWSSLPNMTQEQRDYVASRWIDPDSVSAYAKDNGWKVACAVYDESWIITIQSRDIHEKKFMIEKWTQSKWCFMTKINMEVKKVFVVEWMFDFLTLAQFWVNVVWMKSATDGADLVRKMQSKWYEIIIIPDNDDAGKKMHAMFDDMPHFWFDLSPLWVKDVNELINQWEWYKENIIWIIEDERLMAWPKPKKKDYEIVDYVTGLQEWMEELLETKIENVISWGITTLDNQLGYLMPWQLILVGWVTWSGKSTFVNEIAGNVSRQWIKVWRFVLEDRHQDKRKDDLYYTVWRIRKESWLPNYPKSEFMANNIKSDTFKQEVDKAVKMLSASYKNIMDIKANTQEQMRIEQLWPLVGDFIAKGCKLVIIDHLHYFRISWDAQRYDLQIESAMQYINALARDYNICIILIAHYKKLGWAKPDDESFKDSMSIAQVPNKVLHVHRDKMTKWSITELIVTKNREGFTWTIEMNFDPETHKYSNAKSDMQKNREAKFLDF